MKVYKCSSMADNCGGCLTLDNKYNCGWCTSGPTEYCSIQNQCTNVWLDHSQDCPNPSISDVSTTIDYLIYKYIITVVMYLYVLHRTHPILVTMSATYMWNVMDHMPNCSIVFLVNFQHLWITSAFLIYLIMIKLG